MTDLISRLEKTTKNKLNVGCGTDYRDDFINVDGSDSLAKVDMVVDLNQDNLLDLFPPDHFEFILANDIIEHHYHWEAVDLFKQFFQLLRKNGVVEIRVPDAQYIINSWRISVHEKITLLFGGQDIPQKINAEMDESRKKFPQFFCHKYGWTRSSMRDELMKIGFSNLEIRRSGTNFITFATK